MINHVCIKNCNLKIIYLLKERKETRYFLLEVLINDKFSKEIVIHYYT